MKAIRKVLLLILLLTHFNAFALFDQCKGLFPEEQIPTSPQAGRDLCFDGFAIYYSPQDKKPIYTIEKLNQKQFLAPHPRRTINFMKKLASLMQKEPSFQTTAGAAMTEDTMSPQET